MLYKRSRKKPDLHIEIEDAPSSHVHLADTVVMDGVRRTNAGYLAANVRVARTGIQIYKGRELGRPELGDVRVYRPEAEVFKRDAMRSLGHKPVTLRHPPEMVTAKNWKRYAIGSTEGDVVRDGQCVRVPMMMCDQAAIDAYEKHGVKELSLGYSTDLKWAAGKTPTGEAYDAVQTDIRVNHLAVVPAARGGDQLRIGDGPLGSDNDDDEDDTCPQCGYENDEDADDCPRCGYSFGQTSDAARGTIQGDDMELVTIKVDGIPVRVEEQGAAVVQRQLRKLTDALDAAKSDKDKVEEEQAEEKKTRAQDSDTFKKQVEAKDGEIAVLKAQLVKAESASKPELLDQMVKDRMAIIDQSAPLLAKTFVFDGKSNLDIKRAVVATVVGDEQAKAMPEVGVEHGYVIAAAKAKDANGGTRQLADALGNSVRYGAAVRGNTNDIRDAALAERDKRLTEGWKTPQPGAVHRS